MTKQLYQLEEYTKQGKFLGVVTIYKRRHTWDSTASYSTCKRRFKEYTANYPNLLFKVSKFGE